MTERYSDCNSNCMEFSDEVKVEKMGRKIKSKVYRWIRKEGREDEAQKETKCSSKILVIRSRNFTFLRLPKFKFNKTNKINNNQRQTTCKN